MKSPLNTSMSWAISQGILAIICTLVYNYTLIDLFKIEISYVQWLGMIIISACIFPTGRKTNNSNKESDTMSNIETFVSSIIKKNERKRTQ